MIINDLDGCCIVFDTKTSLAELCGTDGVDTITNRNDCVKIIELRLVVFTICGSCRVFLGN